MRTEWGVEFPPGVEPRPFRTEAAARSYARAVEGKDFVRRDGSTSPEAVRMASDVGARSVRFCRRLIDALAGDWEDPADGSMFTAKGIKVYRRTISDWEEAPDERSKPE